MSELLFADETGPRMRTLLIVGNKGKPNPPKILQTTIVNAVVLFPNGALRFHAQRHDTAAGF